jgi:hypothetical protein
VVREGVGAALYTHMNNKTIKKKKLKKKGILWAASFLYLIWHFTIYLVTWGLVSVCCLEAATETGTENPISAFSYIRKP